MQKRTDIKYQKCSYCNFNQSFFFSFLFRWAHNIGAPPLNQERVRKYLCPFPYLFEGFDPDWLWWYHPDLQTSPHQEFQSKFFKYFLWIGFFFYFSRWYLKKHIHSKIPLAQQFSSVHQTKIYCKLTVKNIQHALKKLFLWKHFFCFFFVT